MVHKNYFLGVASSAYQVEGTDESDGRGINVWDVFVEGNTTYEGHNAEISCDHMHHYKEDYKLMGSLGIQAYRFSISWPRLIPNGVGEINQKAVALYRDMILEMKKNHIEPFMTLYHWELPQALQEKGGWLNEESIEWFGSYAKVVAENFSDIVTNFITMNEPQCFVGLGYLKGFHAPGLKVSYKESFQIAHNALRAHGQAVINLRKYARRDVKIGYAPTCDVAIPFSDKKEDIELARNTYFKSKPLDNWSWTVSWFSDPVFLGKYPEDGLKDYAPYLPKITQEDMKLIHQPLDFMGQNIYHGYSVRTGIDGECERMKRQLGIARSSNNWPVTPKCLYWGTKFLYERYHLPIYITENGISCHDTVSLDGKVHDPNRIDYIERYLMELTRAVEDGIDIRGYFYWSFLDSFEWTDGYNDRFGLIYVDYETQERVLKDSAYWYQKEIIARKEEVGL